MRTQHIQVNQELLHKLQKYGGGSVVNFNIYCSYLDVSLGLSAANKSYDLIGSFTGKRQSLKNVFT